jgi:hypothetical protein
MWHPFWYNLPCFHPKGDYNHHHELNIVDGLIGLTMKLLLLHMHVIVNMKNLFEHTILGNMSWFFSKPQSHKPKWSILVPRPICNYMYCCGWDNMIATSKPFAKNLWLYTFNKWITFYFWLNTFFYKSFFNINVAPIQNFHCKLTYIFVFGNNCSTF